MAFEGTLSLSLSIFFCVNETETQKYNFFSEIPCIYALCRLIYLVQLYYMFERKHTRSWIHPWSPAKPCIFLNKLNELRFVIYVFDFRLRVLNTYLPKRHSIRVGFKDMISNMYITYVKITD